MNEYFGGGICVRYLTFTYLFYIMTIFLAWVGFLVIQLLNPPMETLRCCIILLYTVQR
jgi:hypothetical protein